MLHGSETNLDIDRLCYEAVARITGHRPEALTADMYLEGDLGVDSLKLVELLNALVGKVPAERRDQIDQAELAPRLMQLQTLGELAAVFRELHGGASAAPAARQRESAASGLTLQQPPVGEELAGLRREVYAAIGRVTRHPPAALSDELFLEADLGLDSLKLVELLSALAQLLPEAVRDSLADSGMLQRLMEMQTVGDLLMLVAESRAGALSDLTPATLAEPPRSVRLELVDAQYPFLVAHLAGLSLCSLCSTARVRGRLDAATARAAWDDLLESHPILKAQLTIEGGEASFEACSLSWVSSHRAPTFTVDDLSGTREPERERILARLRHDALNRQWSLTAWPLHELSASRLSDDEYEIRLSNHHLISDGIGNQLLLREFLERYAARAGAGAIDLAARLTPEQYNEHARCANEWVDAGEDAALDAYLRKQGNGKFFFNPAQKKLQTASVISHSLLHRLSRELTAKLNERVREARIPMNSLLVAAYLRTVAALGPVPEQLILQLPTGGRIFPRADLSDTLGCFAQNLALSFERPRDGESWSELAARVHAEIVDAIGKGLDRAQVRRAAHTAKTQRMLNDGQFSRFGVALVRSSPKSNLFLPYIGQVHLARSYGPLRVTAYQASTSTNPGTIDNVIEHWDDALQITSNYDSEFFSAEQVMVLQEEFASQLSSLAAANVAAPRPARVAGAKATLEADRALLSSVLQVVSEVARRTLSQADRNSDLEADLGLDSLERIRVVNRIANDVPSVRARDLLECRTVAELASKLSTPARAAAANGKPAPDEELPPYRAFCNYARANPDAVAIASGPARVTYRELDELSNQLAHTLRGQGVGRGSLVGILVQPGVAMLAGMLGILKAGAAYVPLDSRYPTARLRSIVARARLEALITESELAASLLSSIDPDGLVRGVILTDDAAAAAALGGRTVIARARWSQALRSELSPVAGPDDLMTVLFTSGSTGEPKGAMLTHRGYSNRLVWMQQAYPIGQGDRVAQKTSCCFDISVWELFWPLMYGATVCPVDHATVRDPWSLAEWMVSARATVMHFVPSLFTEFLDALPEGAQFPELRWLIFSGEALPTSAIRRWMSKFGTSVGLANLYGPTEASIDVSAHQICQMPAADERIPIGKAIDNVYLAVLDDAMKPTPRGELGELWIGGVQLARGYLNDAQATARAFVRNPFPEIPGKLLYRTGDLVSEHADGVIHFHGRKDTQIKIRGFRVELGEIDAVLDAHPSVRETAAIAVDAGEGHLQLVAFVAGEASQLVERDLRAYVKGRLPEYMVPHRVHVVAALPKNANGKIDRKALLALERTVATGQPPASAPVALASPSAPAALALSAAPAAIERLPLGPAQRWIFSYFDAPYAWYGYTRFRFAEVLDVPLFERALNLLVERHPALRTTFHRKGGEWVQRVLPAAGQHASVAVVPTESMSAAERDGCAKALVRDICAQMRLGSGPLFSVALLSLGAGRFEIIAVGHHLNHDLFSNQVLFDQVWRAYAELLADPGHRGSTSSLSSYPDLVRALGATDLDAHAAFWKQELSAGRGHFEIPMDRADAANVEASAASEIFELSREQTRALLGEVKATYKQSVQYLLLAPLYRAMARWSQQSRVVLSHRSHGRDLGDGRTFFDAIGNFAVNFPVGVDVDGKRSWQEAIADIAHAFARLPLKGISYDLVGDRLPASLYPDSKLTGVRVNYLGNRTAPASALFGFDPAERDQRHAAPEQKRTALIEIFLSIEAGVLRVELSYSNRCHSAESMRHVAQLCRDALVELIDDTLRARQKPFKSTESDVYEVPAVQPLKTAASRTHDGPMRGKVAIITGGGRGIGRTTALLLAAQGARVVIASRTEADLADAAHAIAQAGGEVLAERVDVSNMADVERVTEKCLRRFGGIDILVNNAGVTSMGALVDSNPEDWRRITETNLFGVYHCCRAVIPHLLARGAGKIINVGSDSSLVGYPLLSAYAASKHAIVGLTKSLAEELKLQNVQVNAVCPALVDTDMAPKGLRAQAIPKEKVAEVIAFLASTQSDGITGESINVFGSQDMHWYGSRQMNVLKAAAARAVRA